MGFKGLKNNKSESSPACSLCLEIIMMFGDANMQGINISGLSKLISAPLKAELEASHLIFIPHGFLGDDGGNNVCFITKTEWVLYACAEKREVSLLGTL